MPTAASTDGVTVDYLHLGGEGPPVLLVHATGFCSTVWRPVAEALSDRWSCWALDVRGHGRSSVPRDGFRWEGTAADVLTVVDDLRSTVGSGPWRGVGHSMGGASLLLAEQARPGTFAALWAYEPIVFPEVLPDDADPSNPLSDGALRRRATFESADAASANYASKPPMSFFDDRALRGYLERGLVPDPAAGAPPGGVRLACEPEVEAQVYRMGGRHHAWAGLHSVTCPVTVAVGDTAIPGPAGFAAGIAAALPGGRLEPHPDLGHFGPMEAPDAIARAIRDAFGGDGGPVGDGASASLSDVGPTITP